MKHRANPRFWNCYRQLPADVQRLADRCYDILREDPHYPSLHFAKVGRFWSVLVGLHYRAALAVEHGHDVIWFWIGSHAEYDGLIGQR